MDKLETFIEESIKLLKDNEEDLLVKKEIICKILEEKFKEENVTIIGRIKEEKSLREKIIRNNYYDKFEGDSQQLFKGLSDMIGIRINCLLTREEEEIFNKLKGWCMKIDGNKDYKYCIKSQTINPNFLINLDSEQPEHQKNGKEIYRIDALYKENNTEFKVEIQIKSSINSLWGEIDHKLFYKNYEYLLSQDFYSGLMKLIYDNLDSVEKQLELLKDHMENTGDELDESKEILARILYNKYNSECKNISHGCNIDFRPICKLLSEVFICNHRKAFDDLNHSINLIKETTHFPYDKHFKFEMKNTSYGYDNNVKDLGEIINSLIQNKNVYWITTINLFSILYNQSEYTQTLLELSRRLNLLIVNIVNQSIIDSEITVDSTNHINEIIINSCNYYLSHSRKIELFLNENLDLLKSYIISLLQLNQEIFEEDFNGDIEKSFSEYIKFILKIICEHKLDVVKFKKFIEEAQLNIVEENIKINLDKELRKLQDNSEENVNTEKIIKLLGERIGDNYDK